MELDTSVKESRSPDYLEPELRRRWELSFKSYKELYPFEPEPFLTQTYRSPERQDELYEQGRTKPGSIVTWVRGGGSYHNQLPALAFDIAFHKPIPEGGPWGNTELFYNFASIAKQYDLEWGGDWKSSLDLPHFQVPRYTLEQAREGQEIPWKTLDGTTLTGDINFNRVFIVTEANTEELSLEKITLVGDKLYLKPKK